MGTVLASLGSRDLTGFVFFSCLSDERESHDAEAVSCELDRESDEGRAFQALAEGDCEEAGQGTAGDAGKERSASHSARKYEAQGNTYRERKMCVVEKKSKISVAASNEASLRKEIVWEEESRTEQNGEVDLIVLVKPGVFRLVEEVAKRENAVVLVVSLAAVGAKEAQSKPDVLPEAKVEETKKSVASAAPAPSKRMQKEEQRMAGLTGVVNDDDDDDWKNEGKKGRGKGKGKKKR